MKLIHEISGVALDDLMIDQSLPAELKSLKLIQTSIGFEIIISTISKGQDISVTMHGRREFWFEYFDNEDEDSYAFKYSIPEEIEFPEYILYSRCEKNQNRFLLVNLKMYSN